MKRVFFYLLCVVFFVGCKSPIERAEKLIDKYMFEHLHDYGSYEVVETIVDSCISSVFNDREIRYWAKSAQEFLKDVNKHKEEMEHSKRIMEIWDGWDSYSIKRYSEAEKEYTTAITKWLNAYECMFKDLLAIKKASKDYKEEFVGWEIDHTFRCKNLGGNTSLTQYTFVVSKDFKEIIDVITEEENIEEESGTIIYAMSKTEEEWEEDLSKIKKALNDFGEK